MNGDSVTREAFKLEEDEERRDKKKQGDAKTKQREQVDGNVKVQFLIIHTLCIV